MNISYQTLDKSHFEQIKEVTQREFTDAYERNKISWERRFEEILSQKDAYSQGAFDSGRLVGFLLGFKMGLFPKTKEVFEIYLNDPKCGRLLIPRPVIRDYDYGLDNLIVEPTYRRRGIGNKLVGNFLGELPFGVNTFVYTDNSGPMTKSYVDDFGFVKVLDGIKEGVETGMGIYMRDNN